MFHATTIDVFFILHIIFFIHYISYIIYLKYTRTNDYLKLTVNYFIILKSYHQKENILHINRKQGIWTILKVKRTKTRIYAPDGKVLKIVEFLNLEIMYKRKTTVIGLDRKNFRNKF